MRIGIRATAFSDLDGIHDRDGLSGVAEFGVGKTQLRLDVRYLTGGSDVGYILSAGRADVKQLRELPL